MTQPEFSEFQSAALPADQRKQMLAQRVAMDVARGSRVENQTDFQAVLVNGKPTNHVLHLLLSLVTCGLWLFVWAVVAIVGGEKRTVLAIDDYGNVLVR